MRQQQALKCCWRLNVRVNAETWFSSDRSSLKTARSAAVSPELNIVPRSAKPRPPRNFRVYSVQLQWKRSSDRKVTKWWEIYCAGYIEALSVAECEWEGEMVATCSSWARTIAMAVCERRSRFARNLQESRETTGFRAWLTSRVVRPRFGSSRGGVPWPRPRPMTKGVEQNNITEHKTRDW